MDSNAVKRYWRCFGFVWRDYSGGDNRESFQVVVSSIGDEDSASPRICLLLDRTVTAEVGAG